MSLGLPLTTIKGYGSEEVGEVYGRARDMTLAGGTDTRLFPILHGLYRFYFVRGELTAAEEVASRLLTLAEAGGDISHFLEAHRALGFTCPSMLGRTREAREHLERAIELYDAERHSQHIALRWYRSLSRKLLEWGSGRTLEPGQLRSRTRLDG